MTHHTAARQRRGNSIPLRAGSALGVIALAITAAVFQGGAAVSAPVSAPAAVGPVVKAAPTAVTGGAGHVRPQDDPDVVWFEDFENGQGDLPIDPPSRMGDYASIDGVTYQADAGWFDYNQCNGVVTSWSSATPVTSSPYAGSVQPIIKGFDWGVPSFPDDMCNTGGYRAPNMYTGPWGNYPQINVRRMADVLGQVAEGVDGAASPEAASPDKSTDTSKLNHAVTEWTQANSRFSGPDVDPADPDVAAEGTTVFESTGVIPITQTTTGGAYYSASVDVVEASCAFSLSNEYPDGSPKEIANSQLRFQLLSGNDVLDLSVNAIESCKAENTQFYTSPMITGLPLYAADGTVNEGVLNWGNGGPGVGAGRYFSDGSTYLTQSDLDNLRIRMSNDVVYGSEGNDSAYDNIQLVSSTPTVNKVFGDVEDTVNAAQMPQNGQIPLTFTIVNTTDNAAKANWSFTDELPEGLTFVSGNTPTTTCTSAADATTGSAAITASGRNLTVNGSLANGAESCTVTTLVTGQQIGMFTNDKDNMTLKGLLPTDPASVEVTPVVDISIKKTTDLNWYEPTVGEPYTYKIVVKNAASTPEKAISTAERVHVVDTFGAGMSESTWTCAVEGGATSDCEGVLSHDNINDYPTIPAGGTVTYTVTGKIAQNADGNIVNTATATPPPGVTDPECDPNCDSTVTTKEGSIDIIKYINGQDANTLDEGDRAEVAAGSTMTVKYVVTNTGTIDLTKVVVTDDVISPLPSAANIGDLAAGNSVEFEVSYPAPAEGGKIHTNVGTVRGTPVDPKRPTDSGLTELTDSDPANAVTPYNPAIDVIKTINGEDANEAPGVEVLPGSPMTVVFTITNTGNVTLKNVDLTDDKIKDLPAECSVAELAPGASYTCETTITAPAEGGKAHMNTADVVGTPPQNDLTPDVPPTPVTDEDPANAITTYTPAIEVVKTINGEDANEAPGVEVEPGSDMVVFFTITNTGNVTLTDIKLADSTIATLPDDCFRRTLAPGESYTCEDTIVAPAEGGMNHTNVANVSGVPPQNEETPDVPPTPVTDEDPANAHTVYTPAIDVIKTINGEDANEAPGVDVAPGSAMDVVFTITNTGNVTLTDVVLTDDTIAELPAECSVATLAPGASYTCTVTVTAPAEGGVNHTNVGTVTGVPPQNEATPDVPPTPVTDEDPANAHTTYTPAIDVIKTINGEDANEAPGVEVAPGSAMDVVFTITNTGNVTLTDVVLTDDTIAELPAECSVATLAPGASYSCAVTIVAPADAGKMHTNVGTVTGVPPQDEATPEVPPTPVTDEDPANAHTTYTPAIDIVKTINGDDANEAPGVFVEPNSDMVVEFTVTNTGNVTLTDVTITDDKIAELPAECSVATLAPGASYTCSVTIKTPAEGGQVHANTGTVVGTPPQNEATPDVPPTPVTDKDPAHAYTAAGPAIAIVKTINGDDANEAPGVEVTPGDDMVVEFTVTNIGNVTLHDVAVTDDTITDLPDTCTVDSLAPGASFTCTVTIKAPAEGGQTHKNVGTVTGTPPVDESNPEVPPTPVTDDDPANSHTPYEPGISIIKTLNGEDANTAPGVSIPAGSDMTFEYTVTNTGNVTLTNVTVTDDKIPNLPASCTVASLAPGESFSCTVTVKAPTAEGTQYTNVGTVTGMPPQDQTTDVPATPVEDTDVANGKIQAHSLPVTGMAEMTLWGAAAALMLALGLGLMAMRRQRQQ